jgi:hypothetical protein
VAAGNTQVDAVAEHDEYAGHDASVAASRGVVQVARPTSFEELVLECRAVEMPAGDILQAGDTRAHSHDQVVQAPVLLDTTSCLDST